MTRAVRVGSFVRVHGEGADVFHVAVVEADTVVLDTGVRESTSKLEVLSRRALQRHIRALTEQRDRLSREITALTAGLRRPR